MHPSFFDTEHNKVNHVFTPVFCNGGGFLSVKDVFSETGYPAFYQWEQSLKEMKWFCPPNDT